MFLTFLMTGVTFSMRCKLDSVREETNYNTRDSWFIHWSSPTCHSCRYNMGCTHLPSISLKIAKIVDWVIFCLFSRSNLNIHMIQKKTSSKLLKKYNYSFYTSLIKIFYFCLIVVVYYSVFHWLTRQIENKSKMLLLVLEKVLSKFKVYSD